MSLKKRITGLVVSISMIVVVTTLGSLNVFADSATVSKPFVTAKGMEVRLLDDSFSPQVITILKGNKTTIILKNQGKKEHTFTVKQLGIDVEVQPGKEKTITVNANNPGTYELICRYHFQEGMVGKVIVK